MSMHACSVCYQIGNQTIVQSLSLRIKPGELVVVLGQNGTGKTSLLSILSGCPKPTAGFVSLEGKDLQAWDWEQLACRRSVLTQFQMTGNDFLVEQIVRLGASPYEHHTAAARIHRILAEVLEWFEISALKQKPYAHLSGGERQRTQLARVFLQAMLCLDEQPAYLLLDEPDAKLDIYHQGLLLKHLQTITRRGGGVLMVTHNLNHALHYANWVVLMQAAGGSFQGTPQEVMTKENLVKAFGEVEIEFLKDAQDRVCIVVN